MRIHRFFALFLAVVASRTSSAQLTIPSEFETVGTSYSPLFSYFAGVSAFGVEPSATTIHSGRSLRIWADFQHDNFFRIAGFAIGTLGIDRGAGALMFPSAADTFSITIEAPTSPYTAGQLQLTVALREDDNGDGIIDVIGTDDQWESDNIPVLTGRHIYNIPLSTFVDADPTVGNNVPNFATTPRMGLLLTLESRTGYPGGILETPISLLIDHVGLYTGAQAIPGTACPADYNHDGAASIADLFDFLHDWFIRDPAAEFDGVPGIGLEDLFRFLEDWFTGCP